MLNGTGRETFAGPGRPDPLAAASRGRLFGASLLPQPGAPAIGGSRRLPLLQLLTLQLAEPTALLLHAILFAVVMPLSSDCGLELGHAGLRSVVRRALGLSPAHDAPAC